MAASVTQSQIRAVDPFASYNSNIVNRLTRIITRNRNSIHQQTDFDVTLNTLFPTTQLDISTGILFISDMFIEVQAPFTVDFMDADFYEPTTIPMDSTGEYLLTIKYEYAISDPPPVGNIVILKPDQYALFKATGSPYLLYKVATVIDNGGTFEINSLADAHSTDPDIKRVYHELEERLIAVESQLATGSISAIPNSIAIRDPNADLYANNFYGDLVGSAETLTNPRQISLSGDVLGSVIFDGSQDVVILTTTSSQLYDREFNIVIDSTSGNFITFVDYLNANPKEGDRILINEDQILSSMLILPKGILIKLLKDKKFIIPETYSDSQIVIFNDYCDSEGNLYFELRHTGSIITAFSFIGNDNHHKNIVIDNTGIGSINDVFKIELKASGNFIKGELLRTEPTLITNEVLNDISGKISNDIIIREREYLVWTPRDSLFGTDSINEIYYNTNFWMTCGINGKLATSPDGINWTLQDMSTTFGTDTIYGIASDSTSWISCGINGKLATSPDGIIWTLQDMSTTFGLDTIYSVIYDWLNLQWIAVGSSGKAAISSDGTAWTNVIITGFTISDIIYKVKYNDGLLIAAGSSGLLSTSIDGITWTQQNSNFGLSYIQGIGKNNSGNLWIIVGENGKLATSPDGTNWTLQDMSTTFGTNIIYSIKYSTVVGIWIATGQNGIIASSPDGINWLRRYSGFNTNTVFDIFYSTNKWIIAGDNGQLSTSDF